LIGSTSNQTQKSFWKKGDPMKAQTQKSAKAVKATAAKAKKPVAPKVNFSVMYSGKNN
jgi:hypothetical protein